MNRIEEKFKELKSKNKKALITFITAGDPDLGTTVELVEEMERRGADIVELGVPYSDPVAEGPVIQKANCRALKNNIRIKDIMDTVRKIRERVSVPLVYLLYFNCILQYGPERFFSDCRESGVDGVIIPDLPYEEQAEIDGVAEGFDISIITLVAPTSKERADKISKKARGFLYCVSSLGVTGVRSEFKTDFEEFFKYINNASEIPKAIGFGISTPEQVQALKGYCDGLIVGSAIVKKVEESSSPSDAVKNVGDFVEVLRNAIDA
ncbi:tryptophan synthase alpha chain [Anaerobacterium chartisolvens]|uniref:Tryptophan synthase alpha chain n=1 Tax=Anaerobacterium chartisolvens TaxID=1297424 RepID=A0A369AZU2_9FIRM|nr:tryptophan synthase subunit alpha [Anaerobacterium chartisolvens]RCX12964.1 tryptophan synthase alpha chain [Anaerobacterium chartisolvens]